LRADLAAHPERYSAWLLPALDVLERRVEAWRRKPAVGEG